MRYPYEVRRPYMDGAQRWQEAMTVSRHRTLLGALRSLRRQQAGASKQGGYIGDRVCQYLDGDWVPIDWIPEWEEDNK